MSSDEIEEKLKYVRQVVDVAKELGKSETISSLLTFLNGKFQNLVDYLRLVPG